MVSASRKNARESAKSVEYAADHVKVGNGTPTPGGVIARVADHSFLPSLMGPAPVVLDIGANHGQFTQAMIRKFDCIVHAVEPNPYLCAALQELAIPGVTVHELAIADTCGPRRFLINNNSEASHFPIVNGSNEGTIQVEAVTLDDLISRIPADAYIDLIKMDIEGAELDVLEHVSADLLERVRQLTVEFHQFVYPESRVRVERVKKRFSNLGFWVVDFSRVNYDVLFVHPSAGLSPLVRASVLFEKYHLRFRRGLSYWLGQ